MSGRRLPAGRPLRGDTSERRMLQEHHYFQENTKRWRNLRKITIAQVQGETFAAGLMLAWACDLIVAAENARFADPVGPRLGGAGVEYFAHPREFGPRKSKELLLTGDAIDADEAHRLGMVTKVFPAEDLAQRTEDVHGVRIDSRGLQRVSVVVGRRRAERPDLHPGS
jgi:enoyl-CoA hydratase